MDSRENGESRWKWHEESSRRVLGTLLRAFGLIGVAYGLVSYVLDRWIANLDPALFAASVVMLLVSIPVLWRVKPAAWP